jgi:hypothetical protein
MSTLGFCLTKAQEAKFAAAVGTEPVSLQNGVGGDTVALLTRLGNIFYADRLHKCFEYRLAYGNDGLPGGVAHFINLNTPKCAWGVNPSNAPPAP